MNRYLEAAFATIGIITTEFIVVYQILRFMGWLAFWRRRRAAECTCVCAHCVEEGLVAGETAP